MSVNVWLTVSQQSTNTQPTVDQLTLGSLLYTEDDVDGSEKVTWKCNFMFL